MKKIKKNITFIYMDKAEKAMYTPIAEEAIKRGYTVSFTTNKFAKAEIGFYCQHINYPKNSKFSFIMLHDIIQQYSNWPNIWYNEPWNEYDVGILPSNQWEHNWIESSCYHYARPRKGIYKVGWPKADVVSKIQNASHKKDFLESHGLDSSKRTILYAPAWENDGKQDDFVQAMLKLNVNILIKQAPWVKEEYPEIYNNVLEMEQKHKGLKNVCILPMETNIFEAIAISDILVSEESSTMCEASMMGIPAVSVSDWLIPDVVPSRYPKCDYDFVTVTTKGQLTDKIQEMLKNYQKYKEKVETFKNENFSNIGSTAVIIMDILDSYVNQTPLDYPALSPKPLKEISKQEESDRKKLQRKRKLLDKAKHKKMYAFAYKVYCLLFKRKERN